MTPDAINSMIGNMGFPIVACLAMGWFCFYLTTTFNKTMQEMTQAIIKLDESVSQMNGQLKEHNEKYEQ